MMSPMVALRPNRMAKTTPSRFLRLGFIVCSPYVSQHQYAPDAPIYRALG
ncbi:Uncharacterised protein [Vibrio cholerae]|nr:Uncharacterised protein [Vibrio cholerae]